MFRSFIILLLASSLAFCASVTAFGVEEKNDAVVLIFSFDTPFEGELEQNISDGMLTLNISSAVLDTKREVSFRSGPIARAIIAKNSNSSFFVLFESNATISLQALKIADGYKLQVTASAVKTALPALNIGTDTPSLGWRYVVVIVFLSLLVGVLFFVKRKLAFVVDIGRFKTPKKLPAGMQIVRQSYIDQKNKLVLFELEGVRYLVLVGTTNLLIDKFYVAEAKETEETEQQHFMEMFKENEKRLTEFLENSNLDELDKYKLKAEATLN